MQWQLKTCSFNKCPVNAHEELLRQENFLGQILEFHLTTHIIFPILLLLKALKNYLTRLGIDGSVVNATYSRGHRSSSQNPHRSSQPSVTSVPGNLKLSSHFLGHQAYLYYTYMHTGKTLLYIKLKQKTKELLQHSIQHQGKKCFQSIWN